jgi:hypothetical protein
MAASAQAQTTPNLPPPNPFLATSAFPISHSNPGATEAVAHAGPTRGRKLTMADVKTVPNVFTSHPTIKNVGGERIIIASGVDGIRKILATGEALELVSFIPIPAMRIIRRRRRPPPFRLP